MKGLGKKEKGLMDMDECGDCCGGGSIRGLNGNGKNTIKIQFLKSGTATLEDSLTISYKTKHILTMESSSHIPFYLPR